MPLFPHVQFPAPHVRLELSSYVKARVIMGDKEERGRLALIKYSCRPPHKAEKMSPWNDNKEKKALEGMLRSISYGTSW